MAEPYGMLYGLGAGLSQVPKAYLEGQRFASQQQALDMQNEMMQRNMAEDQAYNQAMQSQAVPQDLAGQATWYETLAQAPGLSGAQRSKAIEQAALFRRDATTKTQQDLARRLMFASKPEEFETIRGEFKKTGMELPEIEEDMDNPENLVVGGLPISRAEMGLLASSPTDKAAKMLMDADFKMKNLDLRERQAMMNNEIKLSQIAQRDRQFAQKLEQARERFKGSERKRYAFETKIQWYIDQGYSPHDALIYADGSYVKQAKAEFDAADKGARAIYNAWEGIPRSSGEGVSDAEKRQGKEYERLTTQREDARKRMIIPPPPPRPAGYVPPTQASQGVPGTYIDTEKVPPPAVLADINAALAAAGSDTVKAEKIIEVYRRRGKEQGYELPPSLFPAKK